jgi:hypothetical protein
MVSRKKQQRVTFDLRFSLLMEIKTKSKHKGDDKPSDESRPLFFLVLARTPAYGTLTTKENQNQSNSETRVSN